MGQILLAPTPRLQNTSIFDPENQGGVRITKFPQLRYKGGLNGQNLGGRFALPMEFDQNQFASAFVPDGNEVMAMQTDQPVQGTGYVADGWKVWKYPDKQTTPKLDDTGKPTKVFEDHPMKGKSHKVHSQDAHGPVYVLMYRPIEIQQQVNEIYGLLSIDNMTAEARGETIAGAPIDDKGMLNERRLASTHVDADIAADREAEESLGRSSVVQSTLQTPNARLTKPLQSVSR